MSEIYQEKRLENGLEYYELSKPVVKSANDTRDYQIIKLKNDLEVLLISDKEADKSAAALDVFVGSQSDPSNLPGLAHFCEHLLFMGTEKYPKENDYSEYLSEHGGYSNAFTSYDHTNYYFEINTSNLEGALDRFSQFFVSSLFSPSCTEREIKAVDSENKKNLQDDAWRIYQLQKSQFKKGHPYANFSTGNLDTLWNLPKAEGIDIRDSLLDFYKKNYSANIMKLVVYGKEPLYQLIDWVVPRFSDILNLDIKPPNIPGSPFHNDMYKKTLNIVPIRDKRTLELSFELPKQIGFYESKPSSYVSHFIGHEGPGSLFSLLKAKGWATALYSSASTNYFEFSIFEVTVELTPEGVDHKDEIIFIIFQYIELLKAKGVTEEFYKELQALYEINFRFQEKSSVSNYASNLSGKMHRPQPPQEILAASSLIYKFDPEAIHDVLNHLTPEKLYVTYIDKANKDLGSLNKEKWYGTEHKLIPFSNELLNKLSAISLNSDLGLPNPNPFIPTKFDLVDSLPVSKEDPVLLHKDENGSLFYQKGPFDLPKAFLRIHLKSQYAYASPRLFCCLELLRDSIMNNLTEYGYDANMAGLNYDLETMYNGLVVVVGGYSHKLEVLLLEIVKHLINPEISDITFNLVKTELIRRFENAKMMSPVYHANYYNTFALYETLWSNEEKLKETLTITKSEVEIFAKTFLQRGYLETLAVGNITPEDATKVLKHVQGEMQLNTLHPTEMVGRRGVIIPGPGSSYVHQVVVHNPEEVNSAIDFYLDLFEYSDTKLRATVELIAYLMNEPAFNQLRTVEQLGYMVFVKYRKPISKVGISILIQSERDPVYLESRVENFLNQFLKIVDSFKQEEFQSRVQALITLKLKKDDNLNQLASRRWESITGGYYDFDSAQVIAEQLAHLTKQEIVDIIRHHLVKGGSKRTKLSLHLLSQKLQATEIAKDTAKDTPAEPESALYTLADCGTLIDNLLNWKLVQSISRAPQPLNPLHTINSKDLKPVEQ